MVDRSTCKRKKTKETHTRSERVEERKEEGSENAGRKNKLRTIEGSEMGERERREAWGEKHTRKHAICNCGTSR